MSVKKEYLDEKLISYGTSDHYPFHMPGHKRQRMGDWVAEEIDITEIDGFDNLHHAESILKEAQDRIAKLCGSDQSFYLVNGSTAGILASICGSVRKGDRILIARNCHKSVYHAIYLMELKAEYLYPEPTGFGIQGSIAPSHVREMLDKFSDVTAVVITSPTYDGVVSDIASIAEIVHERELPLIVDEAHGAHFGFSKAFPEKAVSLGADLCIESLHKTLPSYTQTAVLHAKKTRTAGKQNGPETGASDADSEEKQYRIDPERIKRYLGIYQTSSPSYILMAGMDRCVRMLERGDHLFEAFEQRLHSFYDTCRTLKYVQIFSDMEKDGAIWDRDISKILISAEEAGYSGQQLYELLRNKYHLQMEMASGHYVTAITTIMDTDEGFERLITALREMNHEASPLNSAQLHTKTGHLTPVELYRPNKKEMEIAQAMDARWKRIRLEDSAGCVSAEFIYLYPPGIPIIVPGEVIEKKTLQAILDYRKLGFQIQGMEDFDGREIRVADV